MDIVLSVENLSVEYTIGNKTTPAVCGVSFSLNKNDSTAIVGESGCGKTTVGLSVLNLLPKEAKIINGKILFHNRNVLHFDKNELRKIRGGKIGFVFQDPLSSLNPVMKIGEQIRETLKTHNRTFSDAEIEKLLKTVQLDDAFRIKNSYPHQLSGGMRQRIMLAQALAPNPEVIIADEPTTALDVTIQKEILELLKKLLKELGLTMIFITHNFAIISDICNRVIVMYAGEIVEDGITKEILKNPGHPYTKALLSAIPGKNTKQKKFPVTDGNASDFAAQTNGCKFYMRCPQKTEKCANEQPQLEQKGRELLRCFNI